MDTKYMQIKKQMEEKKKQDKTLKDEVKRP
jgi:hypothetical protein